MHDSLTRAKFEILSTDEVTRIHDASLEVLANTRVQVDDVETRKMLGDAGAVVNKSNGIIKIEMLNIECSSSLNSPRENVLAEIDS